MNYCFVGYSGRKRNDQNKIEVRYEYLLNDIRKILLSETYINLHILLEVYKIKHFTEEEADRFYMYLRINKKYDFEEDSFNLYFNK